jgi:hypothetical protein
MSEANANPIASDSASALAVFNGGRAMIDKNVIFQPLLAEPQQSEELALVGIEKRDHLL